ncbi:MAG: AsmA-like C-terminal region-containing protein [Gallionella sp.]|nr:AsmA-like C-terminal region-containing protein [Gallionella sp.]
MDSKTIFSRTSKGEDEARSKTSHLSGDIKRALLMVDGTSAFGEISKRAAPSLRNALEEMLQNLERSGFIQDKAKAGNIPKMSVPPKMVVPLKKPADNGVDELDFTTAFRAPSADMLAAEAKKAETAKLKMAAEAKAHAEAEAKAQREAEAAKLKAQQEAEAVRQKAEQEAARVRAELEAAKAKAETEAKARALAEAKAKQQIEAARIKAEAEAKARAEAEARARAEAEAKARREIEAAKLKAQQEAEVARLKAEQEAAKAREEAELVKQKALAEAKIREEAERHAREQAEAARVKAEQEAARVRAELEAAKAKAEAEAKTREEAERRSREAAEAARIKAEQEAAQARAELEAAKAKAEAEAKTREEAERRSREAAEAARANAEQEAAQARAELEAAKAKAEAEAKAREEIERRAQEAAEAAKLKAQQEVEEARIKAEQEASTARKEAELAKQKTETEIRAREEAEQLAKEQAEAVAGLKAQQEPATKSRAEMSQAARSTSATVLFFDVVGYTKQPVNKQIEIKKQFNHLVSDCLAVQGDGERIILDTGDGAAIGFMQHPEDALEVAMQFRKAVMANGHQDYPDLNVRIGIHLGPINVAKDMNGRSNMVGDGINDAQRVMSFAGIDQIYISRSYYDFVSRLSDEYANLFQYRGVQNDKHGREHPVYELVDAATPVVEIAPPQASEPAPAISLEPFSFVMPEAAAAPLAPETAHEKPETEQQEEAALFKDIVQMNWAEEASKPAVAEQVTQQQMPSAPPPPSAPEAAPQQKPPSASAPETTAPPEATTPKEAGKPVAQARMPSADEVAKLAETQAKAWAEAEQRGAETAKAKADSAQQQRHAPSAAKSIPVERERRKPMPWGKLGAGLVVVLLAALFAVPPLLPMQERATGIEQMLTAKLQQPVHIGRMTGRLLPTPRLEMSDVSVGETKQIQAKQARVNFALSALFSSSKTITGIELEGVQANGAALQQVSAWMQKIAADTQYPVERIELSQGKLEADGVQLSDIGGELSFNQSGKFAQAKLHADGSKLALDINATPENKMAVSVTVRGSALPLLPNWVFDELTAKGELTGDELVITDLDGRLMGGMLLGDARISWRSGWRAQGSLVAKTIATQNMSRALSGDMEGKARFQMQSASLSRLTEAATLDGNFIVKKGVINGFDIVETARQRSRENLPGGRTHFDELSGDLSFANDVYNFRQLKMNAGVLNATGTLEINRQQLSGRVAADLAKFAGMGVVALQVNGTTDNPVLRAAR